MSTPPSAKSPAPIFSTAGLAAARQHVINHTKCPRCGAEVPITPAHIGNKLSCACGTEILVGQRALSLVAPSSVPLAAPAHRNRRRISLLSITSSLTLVLTILSGVWLTSRSPQSESNAVKGLDQENSQFVTGRLETDASSVASPFSQQRQRPPAEITLEQIDSLRNDADVRSALVRAQLWQAALADQDLTGSDPRQLRLKEVIGRLQEKLAPQPAAPPPHVTQFRSLTQQMRDALVAKQLPQASGLSQQAEALLTAHANDLAPFSRSFRVLQAKLHEAEELLAWVPRIETLLVQARERATSDVSSARECEARAKFWALHTPLTKTEVERFDRMVRDLQPILQLARGTRAVDEAERCLREGDAKTRDLLVAEARELLPGLPEKQILPLLERADKVAKERLNRQDGSPLGQAVAIRRQFEHTLEHFAAGRALETVQSAEQTRNLLVAFAKSDQTKHSETLADIVLTILEVKIRLGILSNGDTTAAQRLLNAASSWRNEARWQSLSNLLAAESSASFQE
jgi:hypothetical protein